MQVIININKLNKYVSAITGQAGLAKGAYDTYVCDEDRWDLLTPMYEAALSEIELNLSKHIKSVHTMVEMGQHANSTITIVLDHLPRLSSHAENILQNQLNLAVVYTLCYMWTRTIDEALAKEFAEQSEAHLNNAIDATRIRNVEADGMDSEAASDDVDMHDESCGAASMQDAASDDVDMHDESGGAASMQDAAADDVDMHDESGGAASMQESHEDNVNMGCVEHGIQYEDQIEDNVPIKTERLHRNKPLFI